MKFSIFTLYFAGMLVTCFEYTNGYYVRLVPNVLEDVDEGYKYNFTCCTNLWAVYPRWRLNDTEYEVTKLPPNFVARGLSIEFKLQTSLKIRCCFRTFIDREVKDIWSVAADIVHTESDVETVPFCEEEKVTLAKYHKEISRIMPSSGIRISVCGEETKQSPNQLEMLCGKDISIAIEKDDSCGRTDVYIPDFKPREMINIANGHVGSMKDLTNDYCNFSSTVIDYKICIYSEGCFETPCGNGKVYTSLCDGYFQLDDEPVSLKVNETENGTIVSIFCQREDCRGNPSNLMVFNMEIITTGAAETKTVCKGNNGHGGGATGQQFLFIILVVVMVCFLIL